MLLKCKMCGGDLEITEISSVYKCAYCDGIQTIPTADDEKKINLFNRANRMRQKSEFDKAEGLYESIVSEFPNEAEAYWGICLCKYGIEYVDDPATGDKVPTCHRTAYESIFDDENYALALKNADTVARSVYEEEAKAIDVLQKDILQIAKFVEPYDVFICYKEKGADGERTIDSVLAQDIYDKLTANGLNVFFARITLEDKLGAAYEPYIFAALNSARVMLCVGTSPEHFNAVWVKNEWSRFLKMRRLHPEKEIIPCFKNMDPYDIPEELSNLQGQDMSKIGAMQDLVRGVLKLTDKVGSTVSHTAPATTAAWSDDQCAPLIYRAFEFLEDGDWEQAEKFSEKALNKAPDNAEAYLVKLLIELKLNKEDDLDSFAYEITDKPAYSKLMKYAKGEFRQRIQTRLDNAESSRKDRIYLAAKDMLSRSKTPADVNRAKDQFMSVRDWKDAEQQLSVCDDTVKDIIYKIAVGLMKRDTVADKKAAIFQFEQIKGWRDSDELIAVCNDNINDLIYNEAVALMEKNTANDYTKAIERLEQIKGWKDSEELINACGNGTNDLFYNEAVALMKKKTTWDYTDAISKLDRINGWRDSEELIHVCKNGINDIIYDSAAALMKDNTVRGYNDAIAELKKIRSWKDAEKLIDDCHAGLKNLKYASAIALMEKRRATDYEMAITTFQELDGWRDSVEKIAECRQHIEDIMEKRRQDKNSMMRGSINSQMKDIKSELSSAKLDLFCARSIGWKSLLCLLLVIAPFVFYYVAFEVMELSVNNEEAIGYFAITVIAYIIGGMVSIARLHDSGVIFAGFLFVVTASLYGALTAVINLIKDLITRHEEVSKHKHIVKEIKNKLAELKAQLTNYSK